MKLVAMLRIKNQIDTISDCLDKLSELVDEIVIVDNGSTDGTKSMYRKYPKIVAIKYTKGFHEGRDKILAHDMAKKRHPDWILWIDGDEVFESNANRKDFDNLMRRENVDIITFRMYNFWKSTLKYRVDGPWLRYTAFPQREMWRNSPQASFRNLAFHNGGIVSANAKKIISVIRIKHFGFRKAKQIMSKQAQYLKLQNDPMYIKTMPVDEAGMVLWNWRESKSHSLNKTIQIYEDILWKTVLFHQSLALPKQ